MSLLYTHNRSKRKLPSAKVVRANAAHAEWLQSIGYTGKRKNVDRSYNLEQSFVAISTERGAAPVSNGIGNGFKRSVDDYKWKRDREETAATAKAIEEKKKRLAPIANKTGYQYITDGADVETLGRKV